MTYHLPRDTYPPHSTDWTELVIKKDTAYMVLGTKRLQYLDLTNYLAAGTSLSSFYKVHNVKDPKSFFPMTGLVV